MLHSIDYSQTHSSYNPVSSRGLEDAVILLHSLFLFRTSVSIVTVHDYDMRDLFVISSAPKLIIKAPSFRTELWFSTPVPNIEGIHVMTVADRMLHGNPGSNSC